MNVSPPNPVQKSLAESLRTVHVGLRDDLEVSRHIFRGEAFYIVRDPLTFESQRLSLEDYQVFVGIDSSRQLREIFDALVKAGRLEQSDEDQFYNFVLQLHRVGFLRLPISDSKGLYERYRARIRGKHKSMLFGIMFLKVPLFRPDSFLNRTMRFARPLFTRTAFATWLLLMSTAVYVASTHWQELSQPLNGVLLTKNLPLLWLTLVVLKAFHEFGHAYACKRYGGHVPEMGAYFLLFTPCAYVDATASWGFPKKRERIIVCLAGMYIESIIAAFALFTWMMTESSLLNSICYNVIFLASTVTVLFNINPLMRYDGYYVASDLLEIPNLRQRSSRYFLSVVKRLLLGVRAPTEDGTWKLRATLLIFGTLASLYRVTIMLAIAAVLASKFSTAGLVFGVFFLILTLHRVIRRLVQYLWHSEETAGMRWRSGAIGITALVLLPLVAVIVPFQRSVCISGVIAGQREAVVRAATPGFLESVQVKPGDSILAGEAIVELSDIARTETLLAAEAQEKATQLRIEAFRSQNPTRQAQEESRLPAQEAAVERARDDQERLTVRAPNSGTIATVLPEKDEGRYVEVGTPVARVVGGGWEVRAMIAEEQISHAHVSPGMSVEFRPRAFPEQTIRGLVKTAAPAGSRAIDLPAITHVFGGDVPVNAATGAAIQPYFELVVELDEPPDGALRHGMTGQLRLPGEPESLAKSTGRRIMRFWNRMMRG